jgi:light-regulated signal transduction histidine kinase (bacteriophytochrome)
MLYMVEDLNKTTAELKEERWKLEDVNKELEAFSYSISHDLRAPLRAIEGFSRIIEEEYSGALDDEGTRLLRIVRENTRKMDELITDVLELSRTGRKEMNVTEIDMRAMAESMYNEIAPGDSIDTFEFSVSDLPPAVADPSLMKRVWTNLISNAVKYTMPKERKVIEITGSLEGDACVYSVRDTGVGFDPEYKDKLFILFQRLHSAEVFEGTGVGLAIVQRIISRHGGSVWAEGREGEGAVFSFSLPRGKTPNEGGGNE